MNMHRAYVNAVREKRIAEAAMERLALDLKLSGSPTDDDYLTMQSDLRQIVRGAKVIINRYERMSPLARHISLIRSTGSNLG